MKHTKGLFLLLASIVFLASFSGCSPKKAALYQLAAVQEKISPDISSAYVVEQYTGTVVFDRKSQMPSRQGSLNHVMVALLVLEISSGDTTIKVTSNKETFKDIEGKPYPNINIEPGETYTVDDLLYAMLLNNAYDAANLLAQHFGDGNIDTFVGKMNAKLSEIGMTPGGGNGTLFQDPNGVKEQEQYTNAAEYYKLVKYALDTQPKFLEYFNKNQHDIQKYGNHVAYSVKNRNPFSNPDLSSSYPGAKGIAYSSSLSGENQDSLITYVTIGNNSYIGVFMGAPSSGGDKSDNAFAIYNPKPSSSQPPSSSSTSSAASSSGSSAEGSASSSTEPSASSEPPASQAEPILPSGAGQIFDWIGSEISIVQKAKDSETLFSVSMQGDQFSKKEIRVGLGKPWNEIFPIAPDENNVQIICYNPSRFSEELTKGQVLGLAHLVNMSNKETADINLVALDNSNTSSLVQFSLVLLRIIVILAVILFLLLFIIRSWNLRQKRRARAAKMQAARKAAMNGRSVQGPPSSSHTGASRTKTSQRKNLPRTSQKTSRYQNRPHKKGTGKPPNRPPSRNK